MLSLQENESIIWMIGPVSFHIVPCNVYQMLGPFTLNDQHLFRVKGPGSNVSKHYKADYLFQCFDRLAKPFCGSNGTFFSWRRAFSPYFWLLCIYSSGVIHLIDSMIPSWCGFSDGCCSNLCLPQVWSNWPVDVPHGGDWLHWTGIMSLRWVMLQWNKNQHQSECM